MKKTVWRVVLLCVAVLLIAAAGTVGYCLRQGIGFSQARYIETAQGHMLLLDGSPVSMSGKDGLFDGLRTGDRVLVAHGLIAETYPGQAKAYMCIKKSDGTEADIPAEVLQSLQEMGWIVSDGAQMPPAQPEDAAGQEVTYAYGCVTMSLILPDGWTYRIVEGTDAGNQYGIEFRPKGYEQSMALYGYPAGVGFCGTGLEFENTTVAGHDASVAWYTEDNLERLEHVFFTDIPGDFVYINRGLSYYWQEYGEQIMQIAETVKIRVDTISKEEATAIAQEQCDWDYYAVTQQLDHQDGRWIVNFWSKDREDYTIVTVSADGQVVTVEHSVLPCE